MKKKLTKKTATRKLEEADRAGKNVAKNVRKTEILHKPDLRFEDVELLENYSILEIASLAAKCEGANPTDRIEAAIELLSTAEWSALLGKRERYRQRQLMAGRVGWKSQEEFNVEFERRQKRKERHWLAKKLCDEAERDEETGKILRRSLVSLAYQSTGIGKAESGHALRLYNDWLKSEASERAKEIASMEIHKLEGSPPIDPRNFIIWTDEQFSRWEDLIEPSMNLAIDELKSLSESKNRAPLIHDEGTAYQLMLGFLTYLSDLPKKERPAIIQSQKEEIEGQILSPKTRGAARADEAVSGTSKAGKSRKPGQYTPK